MSLPDFTLTQWLIAALAAFFIGLSKTGFAGVGLVGIYLMTEIMPARESTGVILPMVVFADWWVIRSLGPLAKWPLIWAFLPFALTGVVIGYLIFSFIPTDRFRFWMGLIILLLVISQYSRKAFLHWRGAAVAAGQGPSRAAAGTLGLIGGINTMIANSAGPFMAMYLLLDPTLGKMEFVGTNAWMFLIINSAKLPFSWSLGVINLQTLLFNACLVPAILAGILIGRAILARISQRVFEEVLILFCLFAALRLIFS